VVGVRPDDAEDVDAAARTIQRGRAAGLEVRPVHGERMPTVAALFTEFAAAWRFPAYFGRNFQALEDCLVDLAWLPAEGYLCVVTHAELLLRDEPDDVLGLFLDLLARVGAGWSTAVDRGEPWDRPPVPFHTVLAARDNEAATALLVRARAGGADLLAGSPITPR
jgi:RNAse (barnase) inhibitor barstar